MSSLKIASELRQRIEFEVIDNGVGVSVEMRSQLFNPFMLEENSRARQFGGTGLGLAIASRLLDLMGGEISLDLEYIEGSRFIFTIPFTVDAASKRIAVGEDLVILASWSDGLLKESIQAALALGGKKLYWVDSTTDLIAQLAMKNNADVVIILGHDADNDLVEYCTEHSIRVIYISPRPSRFNSRDMSKVYSDPLLPSALARAVECRPRLMLEKF
jgi:K+-sensing histidine kinase KdpD